MESRPRSFHRPSVFIARVSERKPARQTHQPSFGTEQRFRRQDTELEDRVGGTLGGNVLLAVLPDLGSDTLGNGVEGGELVGDPSRSELVLSGGVVFERRGSP